MVGIDVVKVSRIVEMNNQASFMKTILNDYEIDYVNSKSKSVNRFEIDGKSYTLAGLFSAKEAVLKALGVGLSAGAGFKDITIRHTKSGAPYVELSSKLSEVLKSKNKTSVEVSISHDGEYSTSIAVLN